MEVDDVRLRIALLALERSLEHGGAHGEHEGVRPELRPARRERHVHAAGGAKLAWVANKDWG